MDRSSRYLRNGCTSVGSLDRSRDVLLGHRRQHVRARLHGRPLHVVKHAADPPQLLTAAGPTRSAVNQSRQGRAVTGRFPGVGGNRARGSGRGVAPTRAPPEWRRRRRRSRASRPGCLGHGQPARRPLDRAIPHHRRDRPERLHIVRRLLGRVVAAQQHRRHERAACRIGTEYLEARSDPRRPQRPPRSGPSTSPAPRHAERDSRADPWSCPPPRPARHTRRPVPLGSPPPLIHQGNRHKGPTDGGALLAGLHRHLGDELVDIEAELLAPSRHVRSEDRAVERVRLGIETHVALDDDRVTTQPASRSRPSP